MQDINTEIYKDKKFKEPLSLEREMGLAANIQDPLVGEKIRSASIKELVEHNMAFVLNIARRYNKFSCVELEDLVSEGNFGLIKAAEKFDPNQFEKPVRFITYAAFHIKKYIKSYITKVISSYQNGEDTIVFSIDKPDHDGVTFADKIADESFDGDADLIDSKDTYDILQEAISELDERSRDIILLHFGFNEDVMNLSDISKKYGISRERVRVLKEKALEKMKKILLDRGVEL
jgi:RNA polymerase primary sigma factor